jgi:hypothetical protein
MYNQLSYVAATRISAMLYFNGRNITNTCKYDKHYSHQTFSIQNFSAGVPALSCFKCLRAVSFVRYAILIALLLLSALLSQHYPLINNIFIYIKNYTIFKYQVHMFDRLTLKANVWKVENYKTIPKNRI